MVVAVSDAIMIARAVGLQVVKDGVIHQRWWMLTAEAFEMIEGQMTSIGPPSVESMMGQAEAAAMESQVVGKLKPIIIEHGESR